MNAARKGFASVCAVQRSRDSDKMACPLFLFQNPGWPSLTSLPKLQRATPRLTLAGPAQPAPVFSVPAPSCGKRYLSEAGLWDADAVDIHRARLMS